MIGKSELHLQKCDASEGHLSLVLLLSSLFRPCACYSGVCSWIVRAGRFDCQWRFQGQRDGSLHKLECWLILQSHKES
jgi:hypothetical protein